MTKKIFYTAAGRLEHKKGEDFQSYPTIILGGKNYQVDLQEMIIWTALNWRIVKKEDMDVLYEKTVLHSGFSAARPLNDCVERLLMRGLIITGSGDTDYDALYDLLSALYIIPANGTLPLRIMSFLKLMLSNRIPFSRAKRLFRKDHRTIPEQQVMHLSCQALLSTAEIIKCIDKGIHDLPTEDSILSGLYYDRDTTSDNIASMVKSCPSSKQVIAAVANLYLRQQIIFERI